MRVINFFNDLQDLLGHAVFGQSFSTLPDQRLVQASKGWVAQTLHLQNQIHHYLVQG